MHFHVVFLICGIAFFSNAFAMLVVRQEELDPVIGVFETGLTENIQSDSDEDAQCTGATLREVSDQGEYAIQKAGSCFDNAVMRHEIHNKTDCEAAAHSLTGSAPTVIEETDTAMTSKCYYDSSDCTFHFNSRSTMQGGTASTPKLCGHKARAIRIESRDCGDLNETIGSDGYLLQKDLIETGLCTECNHTASGMCDFTLNCAIAAQTRVYFVKADGSLKTGPYSFASVRFTQWDYGRRSNWYTPHVCQRGGSRAKPGQCLKGQECPSQKLAAFALGGDLKSSSCATWCVKYNQDKPWSKRCEWRDCKSCCQCATTSLGTEAQTVCDSVNNGCLANPLSGSVSEALRLRAMLPCGFYGYGDYVLTEDINSWHDDCGAPSWWSTIHPSSCTLNAQNECIQVVGSYTFKSRGPLDIDWDGVADFEWCLWKTDVTPNRCDLGKSGTKQSFRKCVQEGWNPAAPSSTDPAAPYISGKQTDVLQAQASVETVDPWRILLGSPTFFGRDNDCVCQCNFPRCQGGQVANAVPDWRRVDMNPLSTTSTGQAWAGAAPGPRLQGECTQPSITEDLKQRCCASKTTMFKEDIIRDTSVHGITRPVSEWCTGVSDGIEAQVYPGPIRFSILPDGAKRFDHNSNSTHAMDRWAHFNFVALLDSSGAVLLKGAENTGFAVRADEKGLLQISPTVGALEKNRKATKGKRGAKRVRNARRRRAASFTEPPLNSLGSIASGLCAS